VSLHGFKRLECQSTFANRAGVICFQSDKEFHQSYRRSFTFHAHLILIHAAQQDEYELEKLDETAPDSRLFANSQEVDRGALSAVFVTHPKVPDDFKLVLKKIKRMSQILNAVNNLKFLLKLG
jgi:hypothetical protein